jgi:hypothetical protein
VTWLPLCGGWDTSQEHFGAYTHSDRKRPYLAIGLLESDARAGKGTITQAVAAIPILELAKL